MYPIINGSPAWPSAGLRAEKKQETPCVSKEMYSSSPAQHPAWARPLRA
jgi:hypothetical protein